MSDVTIGASESAAALGLSPYQSPFQWWARKVGLVERTPENEAIRIGNALEGAVAGELERTYDVRLLPTARFVHPDAPWLHATPDRFLTRDTCSGGMIDRLELEADEVVVVEIKTARIAHLPTRKDEGEWGVAWSDQIPQGYSVQTQHQIEVTNAVERGRGRFCRRAIVFALIGNRGFVPFLTESLPEVQTFIVEELEQIARVNVALNIPLQPETADDWEIMADVVAGRSGGKVTRLASDDEAAMVREYHGLKKRIEADDLRRKELRARLFGAIGKGYKLTVDDDLSVTLTEGGEKEVDRPRAIVDDVTELLPSMPTDVREQIESIIRRHTRTTTTGRQLRVTEKRKS